MKKLLALILAAVLLFSLAACTAAPESNDNKDETTAGDTTANEANAAADYNLLNEGVLTIGSEIGYPPFEIFADDGVTPIGFDVDLANEIAKRLGLEVNFINTSLIPFMKGSVSTTM